MPAWDLFTAVVLLETVALLWLARATKAALTPPASHVHHVEEPSADGEQSGHTTSPAGSPEVPGGSPAMLLNATVSHGLFGVGLVGAAWYAQIPVAVFGVGDLGMAVPAGIGLGLVLALGNEAAQRLTTYAGIEHAERLRALLAPDTLSGWVVLLLVVLPLIAGVEEFLFRGALIGALATGYGLSPWALAIVSSVLFGLGHGLQGPGAIVVTGALGFVLAGAFILSGSLVLVIVAHYVVNAVEFVLHEGLEW